jgi:hypothetical protein
VIKALRSIRSSTPRLLLLAIPALLVGCVTARVEESRQAPAVHLKEGEAVVLLTRHVSNVRETERGFQECVADELASGDSGLTLRTEQEFMDSMFPWFEPRLAPTTVEQLPKLLGQPGVTQRISETGVRYVVWLDGETQTTDGGGTISCDLLGFGCVGFQWWQRDSQYEASIWDLTTAEAAGVISTAATGTSYMPAIVVPIPILARTRAAACQGLANQLKEFLVLAPSSPPTAAQ